MNSNRTRKITFTALFAALVFIFSAFFQIPFATPFGQSRFHLGNVLCILSGILLNPLYGGLSAGLGSVIFDLTNPLYFSSAPTTFINKFLMGFVAGKVFEKSKSMSENKRVLFASILGQLTYIILYLLKTFIGSRYFMKLSREAVMAEVAQKGLVSLTNGVISVIVALVLYKVLKGRIKFE
jgi:uncharacterized membrane protein